MRKLGDRKDGYKLRKLHSIHVMMPLFFPNRCDNEAFITQRIEDILPTFNRGMILRQGDILAYGSRAEVLTEANLRRAFDLDIRLIHAKNGRLWTVIE